ncbi:MAG: helix-turn-helix transcriptional regulator [Acetobacteraceae bacterium]|nr:helix-turn-helix transcriptional regulator [Acetobacteraceae bacterium]
MSLAARVGKNVRRLREARGLSQEAFADFCKLHRTYLSGVERGARNPTLAVLERIARALDVPAADLLREARKR